MNKILLSFTVTLAISCASAQGSYGVYSNPIPDAHRLGSYQVFTPRETELYIEAREDMRRYLTDNHMDKNLTPFVKITFRLMDSVTRKPIDEDMRSCFGQTRDENGRSVDSPIWVYSVDLSAKVQSFLKSCHGYIPTARVSKWSSNLWKRSTYIGIHSGGTAADSYVLYGADTFNESTFIKDYGGKESIKIPWLHTSQWEALDGKIVVDPSYDE